MLRPDDIRQRDSHPDPSSSTKCLEEGQICEKRWTKKVTWRPFWLQRRVLVAFALTFAAIALAFERIRIRLGHTDMIIVATNNSLDLLTYLPPVVFTLLLMLWNRVDYRIRQMSPWKGFKTLDTMNRERLFINYITPMTPQILWRSWRNGDYDVTATAIVSTVINLLAVTSTAISTAINQNHYKLRNTLLVLTELTLGVVSLLILFLIPYTNVTAPFDPGTLSGLMLILHDQPEMLYSFSGNASQPMTMLESIILDPRSDGYAAAVRPDRVEWWQPLVLSTWVRIAVFIVTTLLIAGLQWSIRFSSSENNVTDASFTRNQYSFRILLLSIFLFAVAAYIRDLSLKYTMLSPYTQLRRDSSWRPLFTNYAASSEVEIILRAAISGQYAVAAASVGAVLSYFLPVLGTGVYVDTFATITGQIQIPNHNRFAHNALSIHILSGLLLGVVVLCSLTCMSLSSTKYIVPKNPGNIAGQISILADSETFDDEKLMETLQSNHANRWWQEPSGELSTTRFRMGWYKLRDRQSGVIRRGFTVNVINEPLDTSRSCRMLYEIDAEQVSASHCSYPDLTGVVEEGRRRREAAFKQREAEKLQSNTEGFGKASKAD